MQFWDTLGGDVKSLQKAIKDGATKKRIMGPVEENAAFNEVYGGYSGDGVYIGEPVTIAASLASAAPILLKVKDILAKAGIKPDDVKKIADAAKKASTDFEKITGKSVTDVVFKKDAGKTTNKIAVSSNDLGPLDTETATKVVSAAVASATGTDIQTIKEISNEVSATSLMDVMPYPTTIPGKDIPVSPKNILGDKKTLLYVGGTALVLFLLMRN